MDPMADHTPRPEGTLNPVTDVFWASPPAPPLWSKAKGRTRTDSPSWSIGYHVTPMPLLGVDLLSSRVPDTFKAR